MIIYNGIIEYLRADSVLTSIVSSIHEQMPSTSTVIPYIYMHLHDLERLKTFGGLFFKMRMICFGFSANLGESIIVSNRIQEILGNFFIEYQKHSSCVFSYYGYKINCIPKHVFRSALSFEVLTSDKS